RMSEGHSADEVGVLMLNNSAKLKDELDTNNCIALTFVFNSLNKINNDLNSKVLDVDMDVHCAHLFFVNT
ncbi:hypothetical protein ACLBWC_39020, partial [Pseudomonas aeruginosa]